MNKTAVKNFAVWAREKLISDIKYKAQTIGITENGIAEKLPQSTKDMQFFDIGTKNYAEVAGDDIAKRNALVGVIKSRERSFKTYQEAFANVVEEVAYTWFNRLIAIRFMEVNDYLPSGVRVLSADNPAKKEPDIVTKPFETDLEFTSAEQSTILRYKDENKPDELFRLLFIKQCNKLHEILPELFEKTNDYSELLLNLSVIDQDGIIYHLIHDIPEEDFNTEMGGQVEIIGWLYQYYISKKHDEIVNIYKGTIGKADIPAATQLFTTDWVVRYMVDNSLGRYWVERNPESKLAEKLEFFVTPKNGEIQYTDEKVSPTDLTFFDPCMGSGHILIYAFEVLMEIYRECGYSDRDAALSIVENNLYGMDIDKRAYQLAYFAVMMKARSYNRRILTRGIATNLAVAEESNNLDKFTLDGLTDDKEQNIIGEYLIEIFKDAQEIGTLQTVKQADYKSFAEYLHNLKNNQEVDLFSAPWIDNVLPQMLKLTKQAEIMSGEYAIICTNPPYMNKLEDKLKKFVADNYKPYSGDLFSVYMYRNFAYCRKGGYTAFMTPFVWMFIKTYEELRKYIIQNKSITTLVQMEYSAFEEATVPICTFVLQNGQSDKKGLYFRLENFKGGMEVQKQKVLEAIADKECGYFYEANEADFSQIPGSPVAYWVSEKIFKLLSNDTIIKVSKPCLGMRTGNNDKYLRLWHEVAKEKSSYVDLNSYEDKKWIPFNKGGGFRRWYGLNEYLVNWENNGFEIKENTKIKYGENIGWKISNENLYFREGITWGSVTSGITTFRYYPRGFIFSNCGQAVIMNDDNNSHIIPMIAYLNSNIVRIFLKILSPTIGCESGYVAKLPLKKDMFSNTNINTLSSQNINLSKTDWDSYETSWDFKTHPLIRLKLCGAYAWGDNPPTMNLSSAYLGWKLECDGRFQKLKANEEELNRIFIDIYGLQDELNPEVADKDITVHRVYDRKEDVPESMQGSKYIRTLRDEIVSLLSYAVGCMLGRYSLDVEGLAYAGGEWDASRYSTFAPDRDNCIPITDEEYFEDDIVGLFCTWLKKAYGEETLEQNLDFIAAALGNKGNTSREVIRNYFLNDFIKDHMKTYQKRPIYWLFDSGKQNGFKALVYMHRWNADTIGNVRVEYLHRIQRVYEKEITRMQEIIDSSHDNKEIANATKRKEKLQKQLKETKDYDALIAHLALSRIDIDLDDGVKVNYEKVQTADGRKMQILAKI